MERFVIIPGRTGRLVVKVPFEQERVSKIKSIHGRTWHPAEKYWTVPNDGGMVKRLRTLFEGDVVEVAAELERSCT